MLTADTITDEQIRDLRDASIGVDVYTFAQCLAALRVVSPRTPDRGYWIQRRADARARCAEILNARAKEQP